VKRNAQVYIEVEPGPVMRAGLDAMEFVVEVLDYIPDWCEADRKELASRCQTLGDTLRATARQVKQCDARLSEGTT